MKRLPTCTIYLTALYVHHICGKHEFTSGNLANERDNAQRWFHDRIPRHLFAKRAAILVDHGYPNPDDAWQVDAATRYADRYNIYCHTKPDMMREVAALFKPYVKIDEEHVGYTDGYVSAQTNTALRRGQFELLSTSGPVRVYRINPAFVDHPSF